MAIKITISQKTYNHIVDELQKEYENAVYMSEVPGQKYKYAWKEEAEDLLAMLNELKSEEIE